MALLSHYTSEAGFIGVVRSQALWATEFLALNDNMEFVFALRALYARAITECSRAIPADLRDPQTSEDYIRSLPDRAIRQLKDTVAASDGYGSLYVCSFARGRNKDEDERGILTLWDRYTRLNGFCLQFDDIKVRSLLEAELRTGSYAHLDLVEVTYGVDESGSEFCHLAEQIALRLQDLLFRERQDARLRPDHSRIAPETRFQRDLLEFCARHKDPAFADEREVRIFAYPAAQGGARFFTGYAAPKTIRSYLKARGNARYIALGEAYVPGFIPERILAGPSSDLPVWKLQALYPFMPSFARSSIPVANG
jgi:hypothetical protein